MSSGLAYTNWTILSSTLFSRAFFSERSTAESLASGKIISPDPDWFRFEDCGAFMDTEINGINAPGTSVRDADPSVVLSTVLRRFYFQGLE